MDRTLGLQFEINIISIAFPLSQINNSGNFQMFMASKFQASEVIPVLLIAACTFTLSRLHAL